MSYRTLGALCTLALVSAAGSAIAQQPAAQVGTITGRVTAVANGTPVAGAQVAIVGLSSDTMTAMYDDVLFENPRLRLLAVTGDGRSAVTYELRPHKTPLGDASADTLLGAIRGAAPRGA